MLTAGDLALDEERLAACRAGRPLSLTRTEFALLAALLRPPRAVRSRDELLTVVWGHDYAGEDKVLDVTISRLRAKLGQPDPIRTLHGVGYLAAGTPTD
ncbi:MAG: winged helix-turn-helix transcriptional regulator [Chloroflexi bacterium]|nr:winged helix-turn-helix transcriptional regulator [Chloroflexota bacterium]